MLPTLIKGDLVAGTPYRIVKQLGQGGMGHVYDVVDENLNVRRALKLIDVAIEPGPKRDKAIQEVLKEGQIIAKLHRLCPDHIVQVLMFGVTNDRRATPYLLMEIVEGVTLSYYVKRNGGRLRATDVKKLALEVLTALVTLHENGIVHRDLKPANVMVEPVPGTFDGTRMKLIDFGITSEVGRRTVRQALTFRYGAPEQVNIEGQHPISGQTDLYALGLILYEVIAGRGPFDALCKTLDQFIYAHLMTPAPPLATLVPDLPTELCAIIDSMLEKDPRKRPESARICGEQLANVVWNFTTHTEDDETEKTQEDTRTAVESAQRHFEEEKEAKERAAVERVKAPPPQGRLVPPPSPSTDPPPGHSATLLSPGNSALPKARSTASTRTSPPATPVMKRQDGGVRALGPIAEAMAPALVVARRFHVNETAPLAPELDTRGRRPPLSRRIARSIGGEYGRPEQVRAVALLAAFACVLVSFVAGAFLFLTRKPATAAEPVTVKAAPAGLPTESATSARTPPLAVGSAAPPLSIAPSASGATTMPTPAPSSAGPRSSETGRASAARSSKSARPAPSASSSDGDVWIELSDGTRVPFHTKLPGSGL